MPPVLDREAPGAGPLIQGFTGNGFRVDGRVCPGGVLLTPRLALDWSAPSFDALAVSDFDAVLAIDPRPEFLLLGTGPTMRRPPPALAKAIEALGLGIEPMDSRAAARAWGVLRAEERWIVAALLPLG